MAIRMQRFLPDRAWLSTDPGSPTQFALSFFVDLHLFKSPLKLPPDKIYVPPND